MTEVRVLTKPPAIILADARQGGAERCEDGTLFVVCSDANGPEPYCRDPPPAVADDPFVVLVEFPRDIPPGVSPHSNAAVLYHGQPWEIPHKFNQDQRQVRDQEADEGPGVPGIERASEKTIAECGGNVMRALALHNQTEHRRLDPAELVTSAAPWLPRGPLPEAGDAARAYIFDAALAAWEFAGKAAQQSDGDDEQRTFALVALGESIGQHSPARSCVVADARLPASPRMVRRKRHVRRPPPVGHALCKLLCDVCSRFGRRSRARARVAALPRSLPRPVRSRLATRVAAVAATARRIHI